MPGGRAAFRAEIRVAAGGDGCRTLKSSWNSGAWVLHLRLKFAIDTLPVVNHNEIERNERRVFILGCALGTSECYGGLGRESSL